MQYRITRLVTWSDEPEAVAWQPERTDGGLSPAQHATMVAVLMLPVGAEAARWWLTVCMWLWGKWECVL